MAGVGVQPFGVRGKLRPHGRRSRLQDAKLNPAASRSNLSVTRILVLRMCGLPPHCRRFEGILWVVVVMAGNLACRKSRGKEELPGCSFPPPA